MLKGADGQAAALALRLLLQLGKSLGAKRLLPISRVHIDGCLYHGQVSLDFVLHMRGLGGQVRVPTTLNVGSLNLLHPHLNRSATLAAMQQQMTAYTELGCEATWTCAPYQLPSRPRLGEQIAWAESNAIVFANSVLGARTNRYGDFTDLCAALTGFVPEAGLHLERHRRGQVVYDLSSLEPLFQSDVFFAVLGYWIGLDVGTQIPVLLGLPANTTEDALKAFGAAAASSGSLAMFHAVGLTPEAATLNAALQGQAAERTVQLSARVLRLAAEQLSGLRQGMSIQAVSLGTPHYSVLECQTLLSLLRGRQVYPSVTLFVNTNRFVYRQLETAGWLEPLLSCRVHFILDTCLYISAILEAAETRVSAIMTSSAKVAHYAPANLGVSLAFGSTHECVESAILGEVWYDTNLWA